MSRPYRSRWSPPLPAAPIPAVTSPVAATVRLEPGMPPVRLLGDHGVMDVLSSRVLLHPTDPERSRVFYRDALGLAIYREFGSGPERGTVFFLGGGFLELSGRAAAPPAPGMALWLQVRELAAVRRELGERGVGILREPRREPWGLLEMWIADPDGVRLCIVEVPAEHPLRRRD
jgi:catechol 2,3-dioxygenase-like lactoylglutathione lyase family enzyme